MAVVNYVLPDDIYILVSGEWRTISKSVWDSLEGPKPPGRTFINNGCTCSPDYLQGKPIWPACVIHDYHYNGGYVSREEADAILRRNVYKVLKAFGMNRIKAKVVSLAYWFAVRKAGRFAYNGALNPA